MAVLNLKNAVFTDPGIGNGKYMGMAVLKIWNKKFAVFTDIGLAMTNIGMAVLKNTNSVGCFHWPWSWQWHIFLPGMAVFKPPHKFALFYWHWNWQWHIFPGMAVLKTVKPHKFAVFTDPGVGNGIYSSQEWLYLNPPQICSFYWHWNWQWHIYRNGCIKKKKKRLLFSLTLELAMAHIPGNGCITKYKKCVCRFHWPWSWRCRRWFPPAARPPPPPAGLWFAPRRPPPAGRRLRKKQGFCCCLRSFLHRRGSVPSDSFGA